MKRKRHTPEEIIKKLREAATLLAGGQGVEEVCKRLEVSPPTYHRWKEEYGRRAFCPKGSTGGCWHRGEPGAQARGGPAFAGELQSERAPGLPGDQAAAGHAT